MSSFSRLKDPQKHCPELAELFNIFANKKFNEAKECLDNLKLRSTK